MDSSVLHWNIRSFSRNKDTLTLLVRDYGITVFCLNETWLKKSNNQVSFKGFNLLRKDRDDGYGGVMVGIRGDLKYREIDISSINTPDRWQALAVEMEKISLVSMYVPPDIKIDINILHGLIGKIIDKTNKPIMIMGDLNGQNQAWGSSSNNQNGEILAEFMDISGLVFINNGMPTRITNPDESLSVPDLVICSPGIAVNKQFCIAEDFGTSDHLPIIVKSEHVATVPILVDDRLIHYNTKKAKWVNFKKQIDQEIGDQEIVEYEDLTSIISRSADLHIPKKKFLFEVPKPQHPWWDEDCSDAVKEKREAFRRLRLHPTTDNFIELKKISAKTRRTLVGKRRKGWMNFCNNISVKTPTSVVWKAVKRFSSASSPKVPICGLDSNLGVRILETLTPLVLNPEVPSLQFRTIQSAPFSMAELSAVIHKKKNSSPGMDHFNYEIIQNLPYCAVITLLQIFNTFLRNFNAILPEDWKNQIIYPIPKQGKNILEPEGWRPIILSSCVSKILESMIKNRLEWEIENRKILNPLQFGFRKGRGVTEALTVVYSQIEIGLAKNEESVLVLLDIKAAYDNVDISKLYEILQIHEFPYDLVTLIVKFLSNRIIYIKDPITKKVVGPRMANKGLPQGSPLSPVLFNLYINSMKETVREGIKLIQFADDCALLVTGNNREDMVRKINGVLSNIEGWLENHGVQLAVQKSSAILFTRRRNQNIPDIKFSGENIYWKSSVKYLGVIFNQRLNWKEHIDQLCSKAQKNINIMRALCRTCWGADPASLLLIYKAMVRSHLDYGSILFGKTPKSHLAKISKLQYQALRTALGFMKTTPINIILSEAGEMPLEFRREWLAIRFVAKSSSYENVVFTNLVQLYAEYNQNTSFWKNAPPLVEAFDMVSVHLQYIRTLPNLPCFLFDLKEQLHQVEIEKLNLLKQDNNEYKFKIESSNWREEGKTLFFTDGSVDQDNRVGVGVCTENGSIEYKDRIPSRHSICSAEVFALHCALNIIEQHNIINAVILSDSLSALFKVARSEVSARSSEMVLATKRKLYNNPGVKLAWIPSHSGIKGNERADRLAKEGRHKTERQTPKVDASDILPSLYSKIWNKWKKKFDHLGAQKGIDYSKTVNEPLKKPWFLKFKNLNRKQITTFNRMRSGHCLTPVHMARIGVKNDNLCQCGEIGNLQHILFDCQSNRLKINHLHQKLYCSINSFPFSLHDILFHNICPSIIVAISHFLSDIELKL